MLFTSVHAREQGAQSASGHVLVLKHSDKTVLVGVPESYAVSFVHKLCCFLSEP